MTLTSTPPTARRPGAERAVSSSAEDTGSAPATGQAAATGSATAGATFPAADKVAARRDELATAALRTLAERGYANTSLREIAQNSAFSHGVLHYYFADKTELIIHCVRLYKTRCVRRYDDITALATSAEDVVRRFLDALTLTLRRDAHEQRLWYDLRAQSLFDPSFRDDVAAIDDQLRAMVWRILGCYAEFSGRPPVVDPPTAYALLDGIVFQGVQARLAGADGVEQTLERQIQLLMPRMLAES